MTSQTRKNPQGPQSPRVVSQVIKIMVLGRIKAFMARPLIALAYELRRSEAKTIGALSMIS